MATRFNMHCESIGQMTVTWGTPESTRAKVEQLLDKETYCVRTVNEMKTIEGQYLLLQSQNGDGVQG